MRVRQSHDLCSNHVWRAHSTSLGAHVTRMTVLDILVCQYKTQMWRFLEKVETCNSFLLQDSSSQKSWLVIEGWGWEEGENVQG